MNVPCSSAAPARSASPSSSSPRSRPSATSRASPSSTLGWIGSGFTPPKYGLRSWWISVTRMRPPASSREIQPEPEPQSGSWHRHVGRAQRIEVQGAPHEPLVAVVRVEALDQPGRLGIRERPPLHLVGAVLGQPRLDDRQHLGAAAAPVGALTLNPLSTHGL